jgi:hypothetical protein
MADHPCREYDPVRVDHMVFQFVRSVSSAGGSDAEAKFGNESPDSKFVDPVVGDSTRPVARFCSAVGSELINWDSCVPIFDAPEVLVAWVAAADCTAVPAVFVVGGGSLNGVSCEALAEEPA